MTRPLFSLLSHQYLGFDSLFAEIDYLLNQTMKAPPHYPPVNIFKREDGYLIEVALAGFKEDEISIVHDEQRGVLTISSDGAEDRKNGEAVVNSIARRMFSRSFTVAKTMKVEQATFENGLLSISIVADKEKVIAPKKIAIGAPAPTKQPVLLNESSGQKVDA